MLSAACTRENGLSKCHAVGCWEVPPFLACEVTPKKISVCMIMTVNICSLEMCKFLSWNCAEIAFWSGRWFVEAWPEFDSAMWTSFFFFLLVELNDTRVIHEAEYNAWALRSFETKPNTKHSEPRSTQSPVGTLDLLRTRTGTNARTGNFGPVLSLAWPLGNVCLIQYSNFLRLMYSLFAQ